MQSIKEMREALEMTQAEFAREIGVEPITVSRWERGASSPRGANVKRELERMASKARKAAQVAA
jgi:DNA-binding transcriptional regulator YiaG